MVIHDGKQFERVDVMLSMLTFSVLLLTTEVSHLMDSFISPCKSGDYITIDSLYDHCKAPSTCREKNPCEDRMVLVRGYIDYGNVFDKKNYPMLPYQKFSITNYERNKTLEVWVNTEQSEEIFEKIYQQKLKDPKCAVHISGILTGFDMHIMTTCHRDLKLNFTGKAKLPFDRP